MKPIWFAKLVPYRARWAHRWYARVFYYFWVPCPLCGTEFGGHEWGDVGGRSSVMITPSRSVGICPQCTRAGRGDS